MAWMNKLALIVKLPTVKHLQVSPAVSSGGSTPCSPPTAAFCAPYHISNHPLCGIQSRPDGWDNWDELSRPSAVGDALAHTAWGMTHVPGLMDEDLPEELEFELMFKAVTAEPVERCSFLDVLAEHRRKGEEEAELQELLELLGV